MPLVIASSFTDRTLELVREHIALVEPVVFLLGFAESIAFLSLLVPSTFLFLAIGGLHSAAGGSFVPVWLAGAAGAFLGDIVSYTLGRYFKDDLANWWPFTTRPEWYVLARTFFQRWGMPGVVGSKFLGMMRPFVPVVAGAMRMPWPLFVIASALSSLMWAGVFLAPGYGVLAILR